MAKTPLSITTPVCVKLHSTHAALYDATNREILSFYFNGAQNQERFFQWAEDVGHIVDVFNGVEPEHATIALPVYTNKYSILDANGAIVAWNIMHNDAQIEADMTAIASALNSGVPGIIDHDTFTTEGC